MHLYYIDIKGFIYGVRNMEYIRIQVKYCSSVTKKPVGIFSACYRLKKKGVLTAEEEELFEQIDTWFDKHLLKPPFYDDGNKIGAVTWFKPNARFMIKKLKPLLKLLEKYNIEYEIAYSSNPGKIVYEDEYQIGVIN